MNSLSKNLENRDHENRLGVTGNKEAEKLERLFEQLFEQCASSLSEKQGFIFIDAHADNPELVAKVMSKVLEGKTERERLVFQQRVGIA